MILKELTRSPLLAKSLPMQGTASSGTGCGRRAVRAAIAMAGIVMAASGCVSVNAPDKPIVIELNINIKQEVIYRLAADAANTIEENPEIF